MTPIPLVVLAKHPVYYTVPIFRALERDPRFDVEVLYWSDTNLRPVYLPEWGRTYRPEMDLVSGYTHTILRNWGRAEWGERFFSHLNPGLLPALARRRGAAVLVHGYDKASCWLALAAAKLFGQTLVFRGEAASRGNGAPRGLKRSLKAPVVRAYLRGADVVLYSCTGNRAFLADHVDRPEKLHAFPCAVDNALHREEHARWAPRRDEVRETLGIEPGRLALIFPARLTPRKRPLDLARALERCGDLPFFALVVGDGPERDRLARALAGAQVPHALTGMVDPSEMPRYYAAADAFVLLSDYDPSPKSLNEAMNHALPVVVSSAAGTAHDLVREGDNGFVVAPGDVEGIARALRALHSADRAAMGARSLEIVEGWSVEADVEALHRALAGRVPR